jgi:imidazolonepropionase-like amidohydrolase
MQNKPFYLLLFVAFFVWTPATDAQTQFDAIIINVNIVDVAAGKIIPNQNVFINNQRIAAIKPVNRGKLPPAYEIISGINQYLMPGLWDNHVHFGGDTLIDENEQLLPLFLAMGVTTVRDCAGDISSSVLQWRNEIRAGKRVGPNIFTSGPKLEGKNSIWPGDLEIATEKELQLALDSLQKLKVDFVKITDNTLEPSLFLSSIRAARQRGWKVTGHIPVALTIEQVTNARLSAIEHLGYVIRSASYQEAEITAKRAAGTLTSRQANEQFLATLDTFTALNSYRKIVAHCTAVVPTMIGNYATTYLDQNNHQEDTYLRYLGPAFKRTYQWRIDRAMKDDAAAIELRHRQFETAAAMLPLLQKAGVTLLAGTDAGYLNSFDYPGLGMHQELELMVRYGLTPQAALKASVINGPAFFGLSKDYGAVQKGKMADLLLLDANPLEHIQATQKIAGVMHQGVFWSSKQIQLELERIQKWVEDKENKR